MSDALHDTLSSREAAAIIGITSAALRAGYGAELQPTRTARGALRYDRDRVEALAAKRAARASLIGAAQMAAKLGVTIDQVHALRRLGLLRATRAKCRWMYMPIDRARAGRADEELR